MGIDEVLRKAPLFTALDDDEVASLRANTSEVRVKRGEVLYREGDTGDQLFMVVRGKVKMGRTAEDGRESLLAVLGPGDSLRRRCPASSARFAFPSCSAASSTHTGSGPRTIRPAMRRSRSCASATRRAAAARF